MDCSSSTPRSSTPISIPSTGSYKHYHDSILAHLKSLTPVSSLSSESGILSRQERFLCALFNT
eukprot:9355220-Ditylum_brightwellii.AAC.1